MLDGPASTGAPVSTQGPADLRARSAHRADLEGLRVVAIAMVALFHYAQAGVSGGVDVFLFLSGYFVLGGILRQVRREGRIDVWDRLRRTARRIVPPAWLTLVGVAVAIVLFVPRIRWADLAQEALASVVYVENWWLSVRGLEYGAAPAYTDPYQHFWSLSVQGQVFLVVPLAVGAACVVWRRRSVEQRYRVIVMLVAGLAVASFVYATYATQAHQARAYFSTPARLWEFLAGALLAVTASRLRLPDRPRAIVGWAGLVALLACGLVVDGANTFPGPWALWPILAAAAVIIAGARPTRFGPDRLLAWGPLSSLGAYTYGFYLWHWPVLVVFLVWTGRPSVGPRSGLALLLVSAVLAWITHVLVERATVRIPARRARPLLTLPAIAAATVVVVVAAVGTIRVAEVRRAESVEMAASAMGDASRYPGALTLVDPEGYPTPTGLPAIPDQTIASTGLATPAGCHVFWDEPEIACSFDTSRVGDGAPRSIAIVGGSHSQQWLPALDRIGQERGFRVRSYIRSMCPYVLEGLPVDWYTTQPGKRCLTWNKLVLEDLTENPPDYVLTTATRSQDSPHGREWVPPPYLDAFERLGAAGIPVIALRDTALFAANPGECVLANPDDPSLCGAAKSEVHGSDGLLSTEAFPSNVQTIDLSPYWCPDDWCPAVIGNVLTYADASHLTTEYVASMTGVLDERIGSATGWW